MANNTPGQAAIADLIGVSVSTVSRALADSDAVSSDVKERVLKAAIQVGYPLRTRRIGPQLSQVQVFAVLQSFRDAGSSVYHGLLEGVRSAAAEQNVAVETIMIHKGHDLAEGFEHRCAKGTACVFLGVTPAPGVFSRLRSARIPTVSCNGVEDDLLVDCVSPANHSGGRQMAQLLLDHGHRKVAFLFGPDRPTLRRRFLGARLVIEGAGGEIVATYGLGSEATQEKAAGFREWFQTTGNQASALFCFNDSAAVWVQEMLEEIGVAVPDDISVIGFDDMPIAELATPPLTTFRIDWVDIGRRTFTMLEQRFASPGAPAQLLQVGGTLVERASVGHPRSA